MKKMISQKTKSRKEKKNISKSRKPVKKSKAAKVIKPAKASKADKIKRTGNANRLMVQHLFKLQSDYRAPDGKVYRVVVSEVYNLRCFEIVNGNMVGRMIKIHPTSDFAKSLVEVTG